MGSSYVIKTPDGKYCGYENWPGRTRRFVDSIKDAEHYSFKSAAEDMLGIWLQPGTVVAPAGSCVVKVKKSARPGADYQYVKNGVTTTLDKMSPNDLRRALIECMDLIEAVDDKIDDAKHAVRKWQRGY